MRKYKTRWGDGSTELVTLYTAAHAFGVTEAELDALADLAVGELYEDSCGDTWERVE